jgi:type II secretory pathway pseudopilin PulG
MEDSRPQKGNPVNLKRKSLGFTLLELMILVAIIGMLTSIGIPLYLSFKDKAARGTALTNLGIIQQGLNLYISESEDTRYPTTDKIGSGQAGWSRLRAIIHSQNLPHDPADAKLKGETFSYSCPDGNEFSLSIQAMDSRSTLFVVTPNTIHQIW